MKQPPDLDPTARLMTRDDVDAIRAEHANVSDNPDEGECNVCCEWPCVTVLLCDALEHEWAQRDQVRRVLDNPIYVHPNARLNGVRQAMGKAVQ